MTRAAVSRRGALFVALAFTVLLSATIASPAFAAPDELHVCVSASEEAQLRRIKGKLRGAREELLVCARDVCPSLVKRDCEQWLAEVDQSLPTVVISAHDGHGHDVGDVRVRVDGEPFLERLDGKAVAIDAGEHTLRYERDGETPVEEKIIIREGEKNRIVNATFQSTESPRTPNESTRPPEAVRPALPIAEVPRAGAPIAGYALAGVGVLGLGSALLFEVMSLNDFYRLRDGCAQTRSCAQGDIDAVTKERVIAGVSLGVGLVALGVGGYLILTHGETRPAPSTARFDFRPLAGGGVAELGGAF